MAKKKSDGDDAPELVDLEYLGPVGQVSPVFGALVVGQRYQTSVAFGAYLVATHPDYWKRPVGLEDL